MSRTVAALYDTRAEAEQARARLISQFGARAPRIIAKDTAAAVDGMKISRSDADKYRDGLRRGALLVVAEVPSGTSAKRLVEVLQDTAGVGPDERTDDNSSDSERGVHVELPRETKRDEVRETAAAAPAAAPVRQAPEPQPLRAAPAARQPAAAAPRQAAPVAEERIPVVEEELRVGKREVARGGARVRAFTRDAEAEEQVSLHDEVVEVENRPSERRLTDREIEAGGLFKERVFEIAEMREEPVVTKVAVLREEVIVRKTIKERTETIRDTVRHTEIEVEDLPASEEAAGALFGGDERRRTRR